MRIGGRDRLFRGRLSGTTTKKIRTDHEILTRENEKLVRKLDQVMREQQVQPGGKHVVLVEENQPGQDVSKPIESAQHHFHIHSSLIQPILVDLRRPILMNLKKKCSYSSLIHSFDFISLEI